MRVLVSKNNEKQPIHSGHFMVSNFEDETQEEDEVLVPNDPEEALRTESVITFVPQIKRARVDADYNHKNACPAIKQEEKPVLQQQLMGFEMLEQIAVPSRSINSKCFNVSKDIQQSSVERKADQDALDIFNPHASTLEIDQSLTKLFQCMSIAYRQKLTSPKWNLFKGMKLRWKDKIRLNNVIWRCWHMQFIFRHRGTIVQFASPLDVDNHCKPEAIVLEGKYWKRRLATVTAEYKKWRIFYKNKIMGRHLSGSDQNLSRDLDLASSSSLSTSSRNVSAAGIDFFDDEFLAEFSDTLFTSLASNQPYPFPNAREIARNASIADFIQPGLIQLQPYLDEFTEIEPLHSYDLMNSRLGLSTDDVTSISEFSPLTAPVPPVRPAEVQQPLSLRPIESSSDTFTSDFTTAETRPVDPLETIMTRSDTYPPVRAAQEPYQLTVLEGRPRSNSGGKRTYSEFSGNSGGLVTVNPQSVVPSVERTVLKTEPSREFAVPLARQRSRSRSGSVSKPSDIQRAPPASLHNRPDVEQMPSAGQLIVPDLIPFTGRLPDFHPREITPVHTSSQIGQRGQEEGRVRLEPRIPQSVDLINRAPSAQHRITSRAVSVSNIPTSNIGQGQFTTRQITGDERKESTVLNLLTMGTGLRLQPPPSPTQLVQSTSQRQAFSYDRPVSTSSVRTNQPAIMVAQNGMVSVFTDFNSIEPVPQPMETDIVQFVPVGSVLPPGAAASAAPAVSARRGRPADEVKVKPERKVNHISSEQKRRGNMKNGFDILHSLIPGLGNQPPNSKNSETSKAAMLHKGAEYINQLRMERERQLKEIELLKREQSDLTSAISHCQSVLPATGAPVSRTNSVARVKGAFDTWVRNRTRENWKFWIFSRLIEPLLETFFNAVDASSPNEFWRSVFSWIEQYCSLVNLRPAALNTLREISTKTDILTDPGSMPAYAYYAVQTKDSS